MANSLKDIDTCKTCGEPTQCQEYDDDNDLYLMTCDSGHKNWVTDDTETWK